ncbi:S4 domain protein [Eubacterium nodatum ATCC 33099]|nr:S4 domain protein [Eubacterium nodatum ATCC 33099]
MKAVYRYEGKRRAKMRIDKYLKISRIIKRRTVAKEACDQERVMINDKPAKAGSDVEVGDIIKIQFGNKSITIKVTEVRENVRKDDAINMYEIIE